MLEMRKTTALMNVPKTPERQASRAKHGVYSWVRSKRGTTDWPSKTTRGA